MFIIRPIYDGFFTSTINYYSNDNSSNLSFVCNYFAMFVWTCILHKHLFQFLTTNFDAVNDIVSLIMYLSINIDIDVANCTNYQIYLQYISNRRVAE